MHFLFNLFIARGLRTGGVVAKGLTNHWFCRYVFYFVRLLSLPDDFTVNNLTISRIISIQFYTAINTHCNKALPSFYIAIKHPCFVVCKPGCVNADL